MKAQATGIRELTGFGPMMKRKEMMGVNALEGRALRERFARHSNLTELLKEPVDGDEDSSDEEYVKA